jgi:hypothetical protein
VKDYERLGPDAPLFSRIIGPTALRARETGSYSLLTVFDNGCNQELALSNDWSLNVPPEVAIIDQNGFLRSVNGETVDITISADWGCAGHNIHEEFDVRIVEEESTLGSLVIYGPERILEQSITNYSLELFRKGQPVVENTGEVPYPNEIEWFLDTQIVGVDITNSGSLFVADVPNGTEIIIRAVVTEGFHTIEESKLITVGQLLPTYGTGPIGISDGGEIDQYLTQYFNDIQSGETFTVTAPTSEYVYFASPVSYGLATFAIGDGVSGGMDGATWPDDGSVGMTTGPLTITRISGGVSTDWYLYRSDFAGVGTVTLTVNFDQA